MNRIILFFLVTAISCCVLSCGNRTNDNTLENSSYQDTAKTATASIQQESAFDISALKKENSSPILYLDCSKSMAGYLEAQDCFVFNSVIAGLLYRNESTSAHLFGVEEQKGISRKDFIDLVDSKRIHWASESDLRKMINAMANNCNSGRTDISYLITDGIMSGTDAQISNNRDHSKHDLPYWQADMEATLRKCGSNVAVLVVQYISGFTTKAAKQYYYYCYDNTHVELKEVPRPFYIVALGTLDAVKKLQEDINTNDRLSTYKNILLLGDDMPYKVDFKPAYNGGALLKGEAYSIDKGVKSTDSVYFNVNLTALQDYMINEAYLQQNGALFSTFAGTEDQLSLSDYSLTLDKRNKTLSIGIQSYKLRRRTLSYRIKYNLPQWVVATSSDDDKNVAKELSPKTFHLRYFIESLAVVNIPHMNSGYINQTDSVCFK